MRNFSVRASSPWKQGGGSGTAGSHWAEATFNTELMTRYIDQSDMYVADMTIASLADLGYLLSGATYASPEWV